MLGLHRASVEGDLVHQNIQSSRAMTGESNGFYVCWCSLRHRRFIPGLRAGPVGTVLPFNTSSVRRPFYRQCKLEH